MSERPEVVGKMPEEPQLLELVDLCVTDRATPQQWQELSRLIVERKDIAEYYAAQAITHARLTMIGKLEADQERKILKEIEQDDPYDPEHKPLSSPFSWRRVAVPVALITTAAMLLLGAFAIRAQYHSHSASSNPVVASGPVPPALTLAVIEGEEEPQTFYGREIVELPEGNFQGVTSSGVKVQLAGPLRIRIDKPLLWRLFYGKVVADVPPESHGFTIKTHNASVVDLGTQFGVGVSGGNTTQVTVYEGRVEVQTGSSNRQLTAGSALQVPISGTIEDLALVSADAFLDTGIVPPSVISQVKHNSPHTESTYKIVRGGFQDGALAYVDRVHRWRGVTAGGMPFVLNDFDYVQLPNDWKYDNAWRKRNDLELTFVFNRPTVAYLLMDERLPIPNWLPMKFQDIGKSVGLDKGSHSDSRRAVDYRLPMGAASGESIDATFRVWRAVLPKGGELQLGPLGSHSRHWDMPCLIARPI